MSDTALGEATCEICSDHVAIKSREQPLKSLKSNETYVSLLSEYVAVECRKLTSENLVICDGCFDVLDSCTMLYLELHSRLILLRSRRRYPEFLTESGLSSVMLLDAPMPVAIRKPPLMEQNISPAVKSESKFIEKFHGSSTISDSSKFSVRFSPNGDSPVSDVIFPEAAQPLVVCDFPDPEETSDEPDTPESTKITLSSTKSHGVESAPFQNLVVRKREKNI
ncbi:unnamed protein product [Notodromas monacha]|uniref:Uncharacterized protein n=1 Tax=Notodromas monacha TaxID=399045 RepID=A0A7R9BHT1_9CRUS|nr:unnamed protein product [Notodromas monacha]CAG0914156.1 unnamed protein product [Notodromas monacha]